jgi:hypothetical protein
LRRAIRVYCAAIGEPVFQTSITAHLVDETRSESITAQQPKNHSATKRRLIMTTETESVTGLFEEVFDNMRKTAEANLEMQQELFRQWTAKWPGFPQPQNAWVERVQKAQKDWAKTVKEVLSRHREVLDEQYRLALDSLDDAFRVAQSSDPQEFAKRCESLCRKSLEVLRDAAELQAKEIQKAFTKWVDLATKSAK